DVECETSGTCCADDRSDGCDPNAGGIDCAGLCVAGSVSSGLCAELEAAETCTGIARDPGEDCDGSDLAGKTCADFGFAGGDLRCAACRFDTSGCIAGGFCGDGIVQAPEA